MRATAGPAWTAALITTVLAAVLVAGCAAGGPAAAGDAGQRATVDTCYEFAVRAIQHQVTVTARPPTCAGLTDAQVNMAIARAIRRAVGSEPKAAARRLADRDSTYLARMLRTVPPPAPAPPRPAPPAAGPARPSAGLPLTVAALLAWVFTATAGGYLLAGWLAAGGLRRRTRRPGRGTRSGGVVAATVLGHFGLAVTGLGIWIAFTVTGSPVLGWLAVGLVVLIAGLGMGALSAALPEPDRAAARPGTGPPVTVIAIHGMLATATILLVLLAAIGTA